MPLWLFSEIEYYGQIQPLNMLIAACFLSRDLFKIKTINMQQIPVSKKSVVLAS